MVQKESCINIFTPTISMEVPINSLLAKKQTPQKQPQHAGIFKLDTRFK